MTLTPQQLAELASGLGGSDALSYANLDPRKTPMQLYADFIEGRRGKPDPKADSDPRIYWGHKLEPLVRERFQEETGRTVTFDLPTFHHPELDYLIGHLDGVLDKNEGLEIKTGDKSTSGDWGDVGTDEAPIRYVCQVMHYMAITSIRTFHIAALLGGNDDRRYVVQYDETLASMLIERAKVFWSQVTSSTPPAPVTLDDCTWRWPRSTEITLKASESILDTFLKLDGLRRQERAFARQADEEEVKIKEYMGNVAVLTNGTTPYPIATWRTQDRRYVDVTSLERDHPDLVAQYRRVSNHRVFRLK